MSRFLTPLEVELVDGTDSGQWRLTRSLVYQSDIAFETFIIPKGFITDFASVPRIPIIFELTGDTSQEAATVHDWLYSTHAVCREMADAVLREASKVTGVPAWRRWAMYLAVRLFGASHW